jgi:hypothetical protein
VQQGAVWISSGGVPGWSVVMATDFNGDGVPDIVWQNDSTKEVALWYMGGSGGAVQQGAVWISSGGVPGWSVLN